MAAIICDGCKNLQRHCHWNFVFARCTVAISRDSPRLARFNRARKNLEFTNSVEVEYAGGTFLHTIPTFLDEIANGVILSFPRLESQVYRDGKELEERTRWFETIEKGVKIIYTRLR